MKKLALFLVLCVLAFGVQAWDSSLKDTTDFVLVGIAALLLAGVAFVLLMVPLNIYRSVRYRHGSEIREDGFLYHGPLTSMLVPWVRIDAMELRMESTVHLRRSGGAARSKLKFPNLYLHQTGGGAEVQVILDDMPKAIAAIQDQLRAKSPCYSQREIDWVERWRAAEASVDSETEKELLRRA